MAHLHKETRIEVKRTFTIEREALEQIIIEYLKNFYPAELAGVKVNENDFDWDAKGYSEYDFEAVKVTLVSVEKSEE